jgi:site-specific DNA-methyltransferase (adenine-specific)
VKAKLYRGDALKVMDSMIDKGLVFDAIIVDPPFGLTASVWDQVIDFKEMWERINKLTRSNSAILIFGIEPFSSALRLSNLDNYKYDIYWEKTQATGHLNSKKQPLRAIETISVFYRNQPTYNPQKTKGHKRKVVSAKSRASSIKKGKGRDRSYRAESAFNIQSYSSKERYPRNLITFSKDTQKSKLHPTQKPILLMEYLVKTFTNKGDKVLDFTFGSGTTLLACENLGRDPYGIEKSKLYFKKTKKRLKEERERLKLTDLF